MVSSVFVLLFDRDRVESPCLRCTIPIIVPATSTFSFAQCQKKNVEAVDSEMGTSNTWEHKNQTGMYHHTGVHNFGKLVLHGRECALWWGQGTVSMQNDACGQGSGVET